MGAADPTVIVLAAGAGTRFGGERHKLAAPLRDGTVLGRTLANAVASGFEVVIVTTDKLVDAACHHVPRSSVVVLPTVGSGARAVGVGYSIAAGVSAAPHANGWLVLPGDMPAVQPATLRMVAGPLVEHPVAYAQYRGRRGHPVGFAAELYSELVGLTGDVGARRLTLRYPAVAVEVDDPGVLFDIDTESDLERAEAFDGLAPAAP